MKKVLQGMLCLIIATGFLVPQLMFAEEQVEPQEQDVNVSVMENSENTFEKIKQFIDSKIVLVDNKYILSNPAEVQSFLIMNEKNVSLETGTEFSGVQYFEYINRNIEDMNIKLASHSYFATADNGVEKVKLMPRNAAKEKPFEISTHWWGGKFKSFGPNGTIDLKKHFLNTALVEGAIATALGLSPTAVLSTFPILMAAYDGMVANSIDGEIQKGTHMKGIQVDINNWVPHYAVYPN